MCRDNLVIDGYSLTYDDIVHFLQNTNIKVTLAKEARDRVDNCRAAINEWLHDENKPIYGVTTGLGKLKSEVVRVDVQETFQRNILLSHAVGVGDYFPDEIVRLALLIRANVFARGHSGVRVELIERLLLFLNNHLCPQVPQVGSLGVGDLQPMAHVGLCLTGLEEGVLSFNGEVGSSKDMLSKANVTPVSFPLHAKEALALMTGGTFVLATALYAHIRASTLYKLANQAAALTMEANRAEMSALDERIHEANNSLTQQSVAMQLRTLLYGSEWMTSEGRKRLGELEPRVQDAVSIRSVSQVHGSILDVLHYVKSVLERDMNASTDNPLIFKYDDTFETISCGNFHGAHLAYALDFLKIVMTDLAVISERRSARLLDKDLSYGLPINLMPNTGFNTGFALMHANATAIVGELRTLAHPASIGSIPAKGNQEDHNSMAMGGARKALQIVDLTEKVITIELLLSTQAIDMLKEQMNGLSLGVGTSKIYNKIRKYVEPAWEDRFIKRDLDTLLHHLDNLLLCSTAESSIVPNN